MIRRSICIVVGLALNAAAAPPKQIPPEITLQFLSTKRPSSFPTLMLVRVMNNGYTALQLAQAMAASELVIDGKASKRIPGKGFTGPAGLPPVGEWLGCVALDYDPPPSPGKHKVRLRLAGAKSDEATLRWSEPLNWRQGNVKSRLKEVQDVASALFDGLPRDCAEKWLTTKDGGVVEEDKVRYFLEPDIKVVVPYREAYEAGRQRSVVDGNAQVYKEAALTD